MGANGRPAIRAASRTAILVLLWLIPSLGQLVRYLGPLGASAAGLIALAMATAWRRRTRPNIDRWGPLGLAFALMVAFAAFFPFAHSGRLGPGSDRADALDVALNALFAGRPPYQALTFLGNSPTPLPGALILAAPFHLAGTSALQNLLWGPLFALLCPRIMRERRPAIACVAAMMLLSPAAMQDYVTGGDYLVNALYVAIAMWAVIRASESSARIGRLAAAMFFAVAVSSRVIYVVEAPIVAAWVFQRGGVRACAEFALVAGLTALAINLPVWALDPATFPLLKSQSKLAWLPPVIHAPWLFPGLALAVAGSAFLVRLTPARIWILSALALAVMIAPPLFYPLAVAGPSRWLLIELGFLVPVSVFGGLGLLSRDDSATCRSNV